MVIKTEPPTEQNVSVSGSGNHTNEVYHIRKESAMFEFEVTLDKGFGEKNPVYTGKASGCIDDYILRTIKKQGEAFEWVKIGDLVVPRHKIEAIRVKAVSE